MEWRFIDTGYNNAAYNMAVDEALMQLSSKPTIRFYRWKPAAVSLGYFQNAKQEIDTKDCKKNNIDIVRRLTGGKAVLHDKELTYSIIIDEKLMPKSIIDSYKRISNGILIALKNLGVNAIMKDSIVKKQKSPICFNEPSYYGICINNKKLVGSAQTRKNKKLLQHGSILIDVDFEKLFSAFNVNKIEKEKIRDRITSINEQIKNKIDYDDIAKALKKGFEENFKIKLVDDKLSDEEIKLANELIEKRYGREEWNFG